MTSSPKALGYKQLPEWAQHSAVWSAYPYDAEAWFDDLKPAQREFRDLCAAIVHKGKEELHLLVPDQKTLEIVRKDFRDIPTTLHVIPYGDIWLRDIAPVFVSGADGDIAAACFQFNGWGGKYIMEGDEKVAEAIADKLKIKKFMIPFVLEGGSIDVDGEGTALTTKQCLLNENRNPGMSQADVEELVTAAYSLEKVLWLDDGLANDHTDGHIDNIARFVAPGKVVCMEPSNKSDPNYDVLLNIIRTLETFEDAKGRKLEVIRVPSVGTYMGADGNVMPASYMNFYIANEAIIVPVYNGPNDAAALDVIGKCFPERQVIGLSAKAILTGGGSFHCITQQQPAVE